MAYLKPHERLGKLRAKKVSFLYFYLFLQEYWQIENSTVERLQIKT